METATGELNSLSTALWRFALGLHPWELVVDETCTFDEVAGAPPRSWCVRVDAGGDEAAVLEGAAGLLGGTAPYAVMVAAHHLRPWFLADLAARHATYLMDRRTHRLVRIPGGNARLAERMRTSAWLHDRDCLVLSADLAS